MAGKESVSKPIPLNRRVRASESRSIAAGAVRMPGGLLPADAAEALDQLVNSGYALSKTAAIARALIDAAASNLQQSHRLR